MTDVTRISMRDRLASPKAVEEATERFLTRRTELAEERGGEAIAKALTDATDTWIASIWKAASERLDLSTGLVALGGYGRRELAPGSDVDVVIEVPDGSESDPELYSAAERFMAWCRDSRVKVSHAVRSPAQLEESMAEDIRTPVAYLDARVVPDGDPWSSNSYQAAIEFLRGDDRGVEFVQMLWGGYRQRLERFGKTVYRLEPDLKNGAGGLRDLHAVAWGARVRFSLDPASQLDQACGWTERHRQTFVRGRSWLLDVRHQLHARAGRKSDRLRFDDQAAIAARMLPELSERDAAERFMRDHYSRARAVSKLAERMLRRWDVPTDEPTEISGEPYRLVGDVMGSGGSKPSEPRDVVHALQVANRNDALLDPELEEVMEQAVASWDADRVRSVEVGSLVADLLTDPSSGPRTAQRLLDLGLLTAVVPEFEPIVCHVQHDVYHVYTTDTHSLMCHEMARGLVDGTYEPKWPLFGSIAREITNREVFLLAVLFHDIGKNRGGGHSRRGAVMMYDVGPRLGLSQVDVDQLSYLVRDHLALSHAARRHDISDPRIIRDLANRIRTVETLNQLTVLTFCDMSNVGDDVMNDWNASLLIALYRRLRMAIEHGVESIWMKLGEELKQHQETVAAIYADEADVSLAVAQSTLDEFFRDVPASHIVETPPAALLRQFEVYRSVKRSNEPVVLATPIEERGATEVIVSAPDVPGALADITGAISSLGLNILTAQIVSTASQHTLDIFRVAQSGGAAHALSPGGQKALTDGHRIARLEQRLAAVLAGEVSVRELLAQRIKEKRLADRATPPVDSEVRVVPDLSDDFTVIEVKAPDRIGLLYEIASTLEAHDVNINLSKIDALGTQVIDTFFVERTDGGRLSDEHAARVVAALQTIAAESSLGQID